MLFAVLVYVRCRCMNDGRHRVSVLLRETARVAVRTSRFAPKHEFREIMHFSDPSEFKVVDMRDFRRAV